MRRSEPGWYPDPIAPGALRYWDGQNWTQHVAFQGRQFTSPVSIAEVTAASDAADADVVRNYVVDARRRGVIDEQAAHSLNVDLGRMLQRGLPPPTPVPSASPVPTKAPPAVAHRQPEGGPPSVATHEAAPAAGSASASAAAGTTAVRTEPRLVQRWLRQARDAVATDLAVHGLAYLGVLLLFVGVFGLLYYASEMPQGLRFVAGLSAPTAFFVSGWFLRRRGAATVASSLTLLGGVVLPIVAIASVSDGSSVPPDAEGRALPLLQAGLCAAVAMVLVVLVRRHAGSVLRFVVAPTLWLAAGVLAGLLRDPIPTGRAVARATSPQMAVILVAIGVTVLAVRLLRAEGPIAKATGVVALPIAAAGYVLELVLAGTERWPVAGGAAAGVAALVIVECCARRVPAVAVPVAQVALVSVAALRVAQRFDVAWVAVVCLVVFLLLDELTRRIRRTTVGSTVCLVGAVLALAAAAPEPVAGLVAFALAGAWSVWRRVAKTEWLPAPDRWGVVPAVSLAGVGAEVWRLWEPGWAVLSLAVAALAFAVGRRVVAVMRDDSFWTWWSPSFALATVGASAAVPWSDARWLVAAAAAACAVALAISAIGSGSRVWLTAPAGVWAAANAAEALDLTLGTQAVVLAAIALLAVIVGLQRRSMPAAHLSGVGHVAGLGALAIPVGRGWSLTAVVASSATGWLVAAIVHELRGADHIVRMRAYFEKSSYDNWGFLDTVPTVLASTGVAATALLALDAGGAVPLGSAWVSTSVGLVAVAIAALSRWVPWRRARRPVVEFLAFLFSLGAVAAAVLVADRPLLASPWPLIATLAAGVAVALTMRWPLLPVVHWVSWAQALALAVLLIERAGLPHRWLDVAGGACGAALVLGVCSVDRARHGRADWKQSFRSVSLRAPGVLGAAALVAGGFVGASGESGQVVGWLALAAAAVMLALALLRPLGLLSFATHTLSTMALCLLVPWGPFRHPWSLVLWAAALLGVAWLVRSPKEAPPATRWDLPAFVVAHGALLAALMGTVPHGSVAVTFGLASAVLFTVALVASLPLWAVAAAVLALVAAADVGMGMLALALLVEGALVTAVALLRPSRWRVQMLAVGALLCGAAWLAFMDWLSWSTVTVLVVTAPLAAAIALAACTGIRVKRLSFDLLAVWAALGAGGSVAASALLPRITETHRLAGGVAVAASLAALGLAAGLVADRLGGALRWVAAAGWSASLSALIWALDLSPAWVAVLGSVLGFCVCLGLLVLQAKRPLSPWVRPGVTVALCSQAWAVAALGFEPSNRVGVTMLVLMLLAAEVAAAAVFLGRHELLLASPVLACAAWFVFVRSALDAAPLWFTVPAGVTLLVDVGIIRWILRERRGAATSIGIAVLEYVGMAFVVGGFMVRTLGGELVFGLLAIVAGVALLGWGAATKVRRRAGFGAGSVVVAALLMVGVPLTAVITTWRGPMLWLAVAGLGALAILVAALVEQGRRTARRLIEALEEATLDWERTGGPDVWRTTHPKPGA